MASNNSFPMAFDHSSLSGPLSTNFDPLNDFDDTLEEPLFSANWDQETPPYDGALYPTLVNWEPTKLEQLTPSPTAMNHGVLTVAQQEKLASIAMPTHLQYNSSQSPSDRSRKSASVSSPDSQPQSRKRKTSADADAEDEDDEESAGHPVKKTAHIIVKKTAHNMIEKRYRTNLNDKIAALRDSVPSLRIMSKRPRGKDVNDDREDLQGLTPAHKLNKATVLSKATEYINHLEKRNLRLAEENLYMKGRIDAFEKLFMAGSMGVNAASQYTHPYSYPQEYVHTPGSSPDREVQGMIQVPEDIQRLSNQGVQQQPYPMPGEQYQQQGQPVGANGWQQQGGGYFGKLMVGSLAGLMFMEGFSEAEQDTDAPNARGLFALPGQLVRGLIRSLHSSLEVNVSGYHMSAARTLIYLKMFFILGAVLHAFLPSLFRWKPKAQAGKPQPLSPVAAPSLASSIEVRRQAWLTAIQTVWVPQHNFFLEAAALCLKMMKLSARNVMGVQAFTYLTGITEQEEAARVKTWEIALDAQLAGGDVEVSKNRLILTLLASGTLPDTPARLMLKALHIRVLLWEVGNAGFNGFYMFQEIAAKLARWKWDEAKELQRLLTYTNQQQANELPAHLSALLKQECDDVLVNSIGQRAYNLAWNLPTTYSSDGGVDGMNEVVEDFAIRSPLDAVAAWWSSLVLQRALAKTLEAKEEDFVAQQSITEDIALAIKTAPIDSGSQIRALVARAVIVKDKRGGSIAASLKLLGSFESRNNTSVPTLINTAFSLARLPDIDMSLRCAMAIAHLEKYPPPDNPITAQRLINSIFPGNLTPLGFTTAFKLMERIDKHELVAIECSKALERLAGSLRIWIGSKQGEKSGLSRQVKMNMIMKCISITKRIVGMRDAGYESMSEGEAGVGF
ncbi:hypothetical protein BJ878DRAFT_476163 [Calycina marina]|uniref:BHLH domain-containing protein n=1 Tax=Calycina marina TaxID=1763456 RepID=A0A9P8CJB0_9HELO|nr:hypothetical protein BJ878DRAFT_476163 [Calycina marina]